MKNTIIMIFLGFCLILSAQNNKHNSDEKFQTYRQEQTGENLIAALKDYYQEDTDQNKIMVSYLCLMELNKNIDNLPNIW